MRLIFRSKKKVQAGPSHPKNRNSNFYKIETFKDQSTVTIDKVGLKIINVFTFDEYSLKEADQAFSLVPSAAVVWWFVCLVIEHSRVRILPESHVFFFDPSPGVGDCWSKNCHARNLSVNIRICEPLKVAGFGPKGRFLLREGVPHVPGIRCLSTLPDFCR